MNQDKSLRSVIISPMMARISCKYFSTILSKLILDFSMIDCCQVLSPRMKVYSYRTTLVLREQANSGSLQLQYYYYYS